MKKPLDPQKNLMALAADENAEEVRTEPIAIYILKSQEGSLIHAEQFLRNRKWIVASSTNLRDALAYLVAKQPPYVLISSDHPNKKVQLLPKMLIQAFPVHVIGFAEKGSGLSLKALQDLKVEYKLHPPVSGPAIERMILKIQKEDAQKIPSSNQTQNSNSAASEAGKSESQMMTFKGASGQAPGHTTIASENLSSFKSPQTGFAADLKSGSNGGPRPQAINGIQEGSSDWELKAKGKLGVESSDLKARIGSPAENRLNQAEAELRAKKSSGPKSAPVMESEYSRAKSSGYEISETEEKTGSEKKSLIARGTEQALHETVDVTGAERLQSIARTSNIACITLNSAKFSGYLVVALGNNRVVDESLIQVIQKKLFFYLRANGVATKESEILNLKVQEVEFTDWTLQQAQFLKKSIHNGDEIAIAFFPSTAPEIQLDPSAIEKMRKLSIQNLKEDVALEFDLYIYMPANNKYLLYTPRGRPFLGLQKKRLHQRGITHMHLRKESAHNVPKYQAQIFLNEKIAAYKKIKATG